MTKKTILFVILIFFVGWHTAFCGEVKKIIEFSSDDISFLKSDQFDKVYLSGCNITDQVGAPQLPVKSISFSLPAGARAVSIEINSYDKEIIQGTYYIFPAQPPQILSLAKDKPIPLTLPEPRIYSSSEAYPGKVAQLVGSGYMGGFQIADVLVYPLEYIPRVKELFLYKRIELTLNYIDDKPRSLPFKQRSPSAQKLFDKLLDKRVIISKEKALESTLTGVSLLPPGDYEYVIITQNLYVSNFQPLADWKTKKGIPATIVTTEWISGNYSGTDYADKVRNFIRDAYQNWGTIWVLLGGDTFIVPARKAYAMDCEAGMHSMEDSIACDLYYADLDGNWNFDGDGIFGEVEDSVDLYPEVFVGRASVNSSGKASTFVNKVINYEKTPPLDYQLKMLFCAEILWYDPYTDQAENKNFIDDQWVPSRFDPITKLYASQGNESVASVIAAMQEGQNIINHDGHCWINAMCVGEGCLNPGNMDTLSNNPRNSILYSIGCWPAAFDYDCIAEHFMNNSNGGGVAFIGNSRYGWGSPGNPLYGYSNLVDQQFFRALFEDDIYHLGAASAEAKAFYIPRSREKSVYRIHQYQVNLLGDPEMPVWTDTPKTLVVDHPQTLPLEPSVLTITVTHDSSPVEGALVCVMKGSEVYQRGLTDFTGQISFDILPASEGELDVTVTSHDFLPYEGTALVSSGGPFLFCISSVIDDSPGNGDGLVNPDETIYFSPCLKNFGSDYSYNVGALLRTDDTRATLIDSFQNYGTIPPGDSASGSGQYVFSVSPDCVNRDVIYFTLFIEDDDENSWSNSISIPVATPVLSFKNYQVLDSGGDKNGVLDPGETFDLKVILGNDGLGYASEVTAEISTIDPYILMVDSTGEFGDLLPDQTQGGNFILQVSSECPSSLFPTLTLNLSTSDGYQFEESFILNVGATGLMDNMELGASGWSCGGTGNLWDITSHRSHSGDSSWYCGQEGIYRYQNNMNCSLTSPYFILAPNSFLSFWRWFDVTIYGVDGLYVEVNTGSGWETLDFLGSGGALDSLLMGDDWNKENYDLSSYPTGSITLVRFRFVSDNEDVMEGFYIDDVKVGPLYASGDADGDEEINITDVVFLVNYLFRDGMAPSPLLSGDANGSMEVDIADAVYLVNYLFKGGPPPCDF
ncbi:MAG: C25 family cysteine peptidase [Candidatus Zixiibacteriota bacterium]